MPGAADGHAPGLLPVILLLGGTGDSAPIVRALARRGLRVLVSTVTDHPLTLPSHPAVERRVGAFDDASLSRWVEARGVLAIVDATHPYAEVIGPIGRRIAEKHRIPYFRFTRPPTPALSKVVSIAESHARAAQIACGFGGPVLLTVGSKHLGDYVREANRVSVPLFVRVLDRKESVDACLALGLSSTAVIAARGPFTVEENIAHIRHFGVGVLVTKESGAAGGVAEKLAAAERTGCRVVVVERPRECEKESHTDVEEMVAAILKCI